MFKITRWTTGRWGLLPLRLVVGFGFAAHGYAKLARGPQGFAAILSAMGIPAPDAVAWVTSLLEFVGGILIMLGAFVVPLALPLAVVMATAMFGVHFRYGFSSVRLKAIDASGAVFGPVGYELNLVYIAALVTLAACGPTVLSFDRWLAGRRGRSEGCTDEQRRRHGTKPSECAADDIEQLRDARRDRALVAAQFARRTPDAVDHGHRR